MWTKDECKIKNNKREIRIYKKNREVKDGIGVRLKFDDNWHEQEININKVNKERFSISLE
jgi:hypothetical protein